MTQGGTYHWAQGPRRARLLGALLFVASLIPLALVGVGVRIDCRDGTCQHDRFSLWTGTESHTFEVDEVEIVRSGYVQTRVSANQISTSSDPVIELKDGTTIRWFPRRVSPQFYVIDPIKIAHHKAGNAPAPRGADAVFGLLPVMLWAMLGFFGWLAWGIAKHEHITVDPARDVLSVHRGAYAVDMALSSVVGTVTHEGQQGIELYVRLNDHSVRFVTLEPKAREAVMGALHRLGRPHEAAPAGHLKPGPSTIGGENLKRLGLAALLTFALQTVAVVAVLSWLMPG